MRKLKGRNKLIEKLSEQDEKIILDLLVDNFNEHVLKQKFKIDTTLTLNYSERIIYIAQNIISGNEKYIDTLISYNNAYIIQNGYSTMTNEELIPLFKDYRIRGVHGTGIKPEQMLLYALTTSERKENIEFFKKQYREYLQDVSEEEQKSLEKAPQLNELLQGTGFELEFQTFIQNQYKGFDSIDFEELGRKYRLEYNKKTDTFKVPSGFLVFFDVKTLEYFHKLEVFQLNFGLLHGNLIRVNDYLESLKKQEKEFDKIFKENEKLSKKVKELEQANRNLKAKNSLAEQQKNEKAILNMSKEINRLETENLKLKELIKNIEEDEKLEIIEDVRTEMPKIPETKKDLTGLNVKIVGGKWNSKTRGEVEELADAKSFKIEFIKAEEIFRNSENLKNSDLIIFDTSYNSHGGYYKIKSLDVELLHVNKSTVQEIEKYIK